MTVLSEVMRDVLRQDPGRPLVTFYDHATGERVELSATTWANWVAKVGSLLVDEHGLERGDTLRVDLPPHWLGTVFLAAAWSAGVAVGWDDDVERVDAVVCGPESLPRWAAYAGRVPVLACALLPLGVRFADPLPPGVHDVGVEVWGQPDAFAPVDPPSSDDVAVRLPEGDLTQDELWRAAAAGSLLTTGGGRLLSVANPASPPGLATLTEPLAQCGSLVLVAHPDPARLDATYAAERATARA